MKNVISVCVLICLWCASAPLCFGQMIVTSNIPESHRLAGTRIAVSTDGKLLASISRSGELRLWDLKTLQRLALIKEAGHRLQSVAIHPSNKWIVTGEGRGPAVIKIWDVATKKVIYTEKTEENAPISSLEFSADGTLLAATTVDTKVWHVQKGEKFLTPHNTFPTLGRGHLSSDGEVIASRRALWDVKTGKKLATLPDDSKTRMLEKRAYPADVCLTPDKKTLFVGWQFPSPGVVIQWDLAQLKEVRRFPLGSTITLSSDGQLLAIANGAARENTNEWLVKIFCSSTGKELLNISGDDFTPGFSALRVRTMIFSSDNSKLVMALVSEICIVELPKEMTKKKN